MRSLHEAPEQTRRVRSSARGTAAARAPAAVLWGTRRGLAHEPARRCSGVERDEGWQRLSSAAQRPPRARGRSVCAGPVAAGGLVGCRCVRPQCGGGWIPSRRRHRSLSSALPVAESLASGRRGHARDRGARQGAPVAAAVRRARRGGQHALEAGAQRPASRWPRVRRVQAALGGGGARGRPRAQICVPAPEDRAR